MTRTFSALFAIALACAWSGVASAQTPPPPPAPPAKERTVHVAQKVAVTSAMLVPDADFERTVRGAPFSAQATTTSTQTLADGNRIVQSTETELARDSEGRTRRSMSFGTAKAPAGAEPAPMVFIRDPVASVTYLLAPDGQHATKGALHLSTDETLPAQAPAGEAGKRATLRVDVAGESAAPAAGVAGGGENVVFYTQRTKDAADPEAGAVMSVGMGMFDMGTPGPKEPLGEQTIEGVRAEGTRVTRTIPAGKIGNERPIEIVSETWYSPDLQMIVLSRRSDPRVGETVYRLTNIVLGEPDPSLFQVPAGYTVTEAPAKVLFQHRLQRPDDDQQPE